MTGYAFPRESRLLTPASFQRVFKNPVRVSSPLITILAVSGEAEKSRLGLAVPKKALHLAVWRNRAKRVIRNSFRLHQADLPLIDCVVVAKGALKDHLEGREPELLLEKLWKVVSRRCRKLA